MPYVLYNIIYFSCGFYLIIKNYSHAKGVYRSQILFILLSGAFTAFAGIIANVLLPLFNRTQFIWVGPLSTIVMVAGIAYAIIAHGLFDIRVIIRRTIIFSGLLLAAFAFYATSILFIGAILGAREILSSRLLAVNVIAAVLISLSFDPLRRFLQDRTDQFLFKKEYEQQGVLKDLADSLNDVVALDEALERVMQAVVKVLHLRHAVTFVFQPGENGLVAIKRIKQVGYGSSSKLFLDQHDFTIQYFSSNFDILRVDNLADQLEDEKQHMGRSKPFADSKEASAYIRQHAIKQSVLKKLRALEVSAVVPLQINSQPIGLLLLSEKLSQEDFTREDLNLLELIGGQAISSIQKAKLYEGDQMKSEFVSIASHELLTPISAIEGYLSMILEENIGQVDDQAREYLGKVYSSAKRLSLLVKDLLSVSRIEAGKLKIEPQSLDIMKVVHETVDQLKFVAEEKGLTISATEPTKPLPPVWADTDRTTQILVNLVSNAIKYSNKGAIVIDATLVSHPSPHVKVTISDTGIGMTKEQQGHLFEKFYRVDSPETTGIIGTGLGLYITNSILERMGGTISVKSQPGVGTSFSFTLPLFKVETSSMH